jgi:hypothetical protein
VTGLKLAVRTEKARASVVEADRGWGAVGTEEEKKERELAGTLTSALIVFVSTTGWPSGGGAGHGWQQEHPLLESSHGTREMRKIFAGEKDMWGEMGTGGRDVSSIGENEWMKSIGCQLMSK